MQTLFLSSMVVQLSYSLAWLFNKFTKIHTFMAIDILKYEIQSIEKDY